MIIDYCHNVDGMRRLAEFVDRMMVEPPTKAGPARDRRDRRPVGRAIGVIGIPGDRRDEDQREYGAIAAGAFDEIIVREDKNLRGREPGETAANVLEGVRGPRPPGRARATRAEKVLDEMTAVRAALRRAIPGDLVVCCVDDAIGVYREAMAAAGQSRGGRAFADPGELERARKESQGDATTAPADAPGSDPAPRTVPCDGGGTSSVSSDRRRRPAGRPSAASRVEHRRRAPRGTSAR